MSNRTVRRTYGTVSADKQKEMTGLEFVQGLADISKPEMSPSQQGRRIVCILAPK